MANNKEEKLFGLFPPVTTEQWEAAITTDLKGADYERKLVWRTAEGFNVRPYYRAENLKDVAFLGSKCGEFPYVRGTKKDNNWQIHQTIGVECPKEANAEATRALTKGAESIGFCIASKEFSAADLDTLLKGISLKTTELTFCGCGVKTVAELFADKLENSDLNPEEVKVNFVIDPIINKLTLKGKLGCKEGAPKAFSTIADLIKKVPQYKRVRFVGVNGQQFNNCGSTIVQELAFTLAVGHEYVVKLMEQGLTIDQAAPSIRFTMSVSSNYFMEIAKFRAARMLWANIIAQYKPTRGCASKMKIHAVTSKWNMTVYDPYVNMLRGTTEAMSAAIAGVHSIEVRPFDEAYEKPTDFSTRIARNVQLLLKEESHFNQVCDAAGGSYYIENLTASIAEQAWKLFKEVEDRGGYIAAFEAGFIQDQIEASAATKDKNIATRRETLLGTNQFPNFNEKAGNKQPVEGKCCCGGDSHTCEKEVDTLVFDRAASQFEALRLETEASGKRPKAFMLTIGNLAMRQARAQYSCNFLACAGYEVIDNLGFETVEAGVEAAMAAKADIVVICSSDDEYAEYAIPAFKALNGRAMFIVAGAPACMDDLKAAGIENFIHVRVNVLDTLKEFNAKLLK